MYERDWREFLLKGEGREPAVAQVSAEIIAYLAPSSHFVHFRHDYALKATVKHGIHPRDLALIFDCVERGVAVADKPLHVTFYLKETETHWLQVTIKRAFETRKMYVATFYRLRDKDARKKIERGTIIRP